MRLRVPMADLVIRRADDRDLEAIASVHLKAYSRSHFTSRLPHAVLVRYYGLFLSDGVETWVAARDGGAGDIAGFAVFGRGIEARIRLFKERNRAAILGSALRHPAAAVGKVVRRLWTAATHGPPVAVADFLLLSIAAADRGRGVGGRLLDCMINRARETGEPRVGLYVNADNLPGINAYATRGFLMRDLHGEQYYMELVL